MTERNSVKDKPILHEDGSTCRMKAVKGQIKALALMPPGDVGN